MTKLLYAASVAAILTVAAHLPAMAQSSASGMSMPMITCKDISTMDRDMARSVVFYVKGFQAASGSMQNQASGTSGSGTSDTSGTSGSTASSGTADTTGTSGSTAADAGSSTSGSTDATGSTSTAGSTSDTTGTASGASGGASSAVVAQLPGFSAIDIDRVMSDCASTPDRQLSEVIGMGASGTGTAQ
jgi:hypothetical protein